LGVYREVLSLSHIFKRFCRVFGSSPILLQDIERDAMEV
jgi:hypothetical protein